MQNQITQFFILGRNPELSRHEILSYLNAHSILNNEILFEKNLLVIDTHEKINIQELGGTIKSGVMTFKGNQKEFQNLLEKDELVPADKFSYGVFGNIDPEILKEKFKTERKKAVLKHGRTKLKFQEGEKAQLPNADFYIFLHEAKQKIYFGLVNQDYDYTSLKERDMQKPIRREQLAISPRLAKILINLSGAKEGDQLLDPFCGIAGILQEALLRNIRAYGIDKDKSAITDAETNLRWLKEKYNVKTPYRLDSKNSKSAPDLQFDAIATETPLGELLTKKPRPDEAKKIIEKFENLIIPILRRLKEVKKPSAKIAITFPSIQNIRVNLSSILQDTCLKLLLGPISESRPDQFISREILVLQ